MTFRIYLMPIIGDGLTKQTANRCKYGSLLTSYSTLTYGPERFCMVGSDTTTDQHTNVMANSDVRVFPDNIDSTITANQRTQIINILDIMNVPSGWINVGMTFRVIIRRLAGMFIILQGIDGKGFRFLQRGLDETLSVLPMPVLFALTDVANRFNLDTTGILNTTTLRDTLINFGNQFRFIPLILEGREL